MFSRRGILKSFNSGRKLKMSWSFTSKDYSFSKNKNKKYNSYCTD